MKPQPRGRQPGRRGPRPRRSRSARCRRYVVTVGGSAPERHRGRPRGRHAALRAGDEVAHRPGQGQGRAGPGRAPTAAAAACVATCSTTSARRGSCSPRWASTQRRQAVAPGYDVGTEQRAAGTFPDHQVRRAGPHPVVEPRPGWLALVQTSATDASAVERASRRPVSPTSRNNAGSTPSGASTWTRQPARRSRRSATLVGRHDQPRSDQRVEHRRGRRRRGW